MTVSRRDTHEGLTRHPLSAVWGDLPDDQYRELVESVMAHGLRDPILWLYEGQVLDGWHRYRASVEAGVEMEQAVYQQDAAAAFVIQRNAQRRHLTAGQRAACIVACYEWLGNVSNQYQNKEGVNPVYTLAEEASDDGASEAVRAGALEEAGQSQQTLSAGDLAYLSGVSRQTIQHIKAGERAGLGDKIRSGELSPKAAVRLVKGQSYHPKGPTPMQRLEAERDALAMEVEGKGRRIEELEETVRFLRGETSAHDHEREAVFNRQQVVISALRASVATCAQQYTELKRTHASALRRIRALEPASGVIEEGGP